MIHGFDTGFLVATEVACHSDHLAARDQLEALRKNGDRFALAPQVLSEFIHVVTDPRRFSHALTMDAALDRSRALWNSPDVDRVLPGDDVMLYFFNWMTQHRLGRKRVLDTLLAATYHRAGVVSLLTTNARDFSLFNVFTCISPVHA